MKREFLMQAHKVKDLKTVIGWLMSEKCDGIQGLWDGGRTHGIPCTEVPWANTEKHQRFKTPRISTGLWTRYGQPIAAPQWWLDALPRSILAGEFYAGHGKYQIVSSIVKKHQPIDSEWKQITYQCFEAPPSRLIFAPGTIDSAHFKKMLPSGIYENWFRDTGIGDTMPGQSFVATYAKLQELQVNLYFQIVKQSTVRSESDANMLMEKVLEEGGEGLVFRNPLTCYVTQRSHNCVKWKPYQDAEAVVVGWRSGRIGKEGRTFGKMGALIVSFNGNVFDIGSGFKLWERELPASASEWAKVSPDTIAADCMSAPIHFQRGSIITFKYRELTDDGIPKEASYFRHL